MYLALDGNIQAMIDEFYGLDSGCLKGKGGSMHLKDLNAGLEASIPIVGSSLPLALGSAFSAKHSRKELISIAYFGDGACEEGILHESLNMASVKELPVLFLCENNGYSCTTGIKDRQPSSEMKRHAENALIKTFGASADDCTILKNQVEAAFSYIKLCQKPAFLEIKCFRFREHCGPRIDIDFGDRTEEEYMQAKKLDWVNNNLDIESFNDGYNKTLDEIYKFSSIVENRMKKGFRK